MTAAAPIVFLGPSLPMEAAQSLLQADYRSPIQRGDLNEVPAGTTVGIIDGLFLDSLSVSPMEIRRCMERGCSVYGAASMGALRAVELEPFGMIGTGWIYESYRAGTILGDDEVALALHPVTYRPLSVPLVSPRRWLELAVKSGAIQEGLARQALRALRKIYFADRTPESTKEVLVRVLGSACYGEILKEQGDLPDVKASDARALLTLLNDVHSTIRAGN